ncbi:hypothetical protein D3C73_820650 [compost metagenome]
MFNNVTSDSCMGRICCIGEHNDPRAIYMMYMVLLNCVIGRRIHQNACTPQLPTGIVANSEYIAADLINFITFDYILFGIQTRCSAYNLDTN